MSRKTGVVVKVDKAYVCVRTVKGEFYNLKLKDYTPNIGDIYSGQVITPRSVLLKKGYFLIFITILIIFITTIYNYFSTSATIVVNIPPTITLKINKWGKIIDSSPLGESARNLLKPLKLKNVSINEGLITIIDETKSQNIINKKYIENNKGITVYIMGKNTDSINLTNFEKYANDRKIKCRINNNGDDEFTKK